MSVKIRAKIDHIAISQYAALFGFSVKRLFFITLFFCLLITSTARANTPALLERVQTLHCADNGKSARKALDNLWDISANNFKFPDESLEAEENNSLYAATMDITLNTLLETAEKYPELRRDVERTLLQWNYCNLFEDGQFYDLLVKDGKLQKSLAAYEPPLKWSGFQNLGFATDKPAKFIPELLLNPPLGERAFEHFFHRIYRKQCFPHPVTGEMFHTKKKMNPMFIAPPKPYASNLHYPYEWSNECQSSNVIIPPVITMAEVSVLSTSAKRPEKPPGNIKTIKPAKQESNVPVVRVIEAVEEIKPEVLKKPYKPPLVIIKKRPKETKIGSPKKLIKELKKEMVKLKPIVVKNSVTPKKVPIPVTLPLVNAGAFTIPTVISEDPNEPKKFTVGFRLSRTLATDTTSLGGSISFAPEPDSYFFVRTGFNFDLGAKKDPFTYSWGIGYDDWHPETWSFQINHWGPIKPGEGLEFEKASGNVAYKIKSDTLAKFNLAPLTSLDIPVKGDPSLNLGLQWSPKENWFIRANVNKGLKGGDPKWSYVFGYFNWRPGKINFEYANYGPNELFDSNYQKNGTLSITYNLKF